MLREVALRKALQDARDRRFEELEDVQTRSKAMRRRLRELTDRSLALGSVHGRFATAAESAPAIAAPPVPELPQAAPPDASREPGPDVVRTPLPFGPPKRDESSDRLVAQLVARHAEGFTVGQIREVLDEVEGRTHTYDAAWALANVLLRNRVLELAGTRPGPAGPIRVMRVAGSPVPPPRPEAS